MRGTVQNNTNMDEVPEAWNEDEILPINPLDEKNKRIAELEKSLTELTFDLSEKDQKLLLNYLLLRKM